MADGLQRGPHQVRDRSRLITFDGTLLAQVSSRATDPQVRWTEMSLYLTDGGSYVLEKVGRSVVVHAPGCTDHSPGIPRFQDAHPGDDPDVGYEYHSCVPEEYDFTTLLVEEDRFWALITEQPEQVVDALYRKQSDARFLPRISVTLLEQASKVDPHLAGAWQVERIS